MSEEEDKAEGRPSGTCHGVEFYLDAYWKFVVPALDRSFENYEAMKTAIEGSKKVLEAATRRRTNIAVVTKSFVQATVTGLHAGNGSLIVTPKLGGRYSMPRVYVDCPLAREVITLHAEAVDREHRIGQLLGLFVLEKAESSYRDRFGPDKHGEAVRALEAKHAKALKLSETKTFDQLYAKTKAAGQEDDDD